MELDSDNCRTLDLISSFSRDQSVNQSSENQTNENNMISSEETRKKRKNKSTCESDQKPRKERRREMVFSTTIEMPMELRDLILELGGFDIQIVTQKQLQDSDMNKNHGRLAIPFKKLMNDFTTEDEKKLLSQKNPKDQNNRNGMKVMIIDPLLKQRFIGLKMWKIGSHEVYCLVTEWNSLVQQNSLESGDYIQLWSFRSNNDALLANHQNQALTSNLCFALVKLDISEGIFKFI